MLKLDKILFPTDFSSCAEQAFTWAVELATVYRAELHVFHGLALGALFDDDARDQLEALAHRLDAVASRRLGALVPPVGSTMRVKRVARRGISVASLIRDYSDEENIDLTVLGAHGRRGPASVLLGSVSEEVVRTSTNPVLVIRECDTPRAPSAVESILVPLDLSESSIRALGYAKSLAAALGAKLQLLHVVESMIYPSFYGLKQSSFASALADAEILAKQELVRAAERASGPKVELTAHVGRGDAVPAIVDFADSMRSGLIVMASHGLAGLKQLFLGSVAEKVVRRTRAPVLVVKVNDDGESTLE